MPELPEVETIARGLAGTAVDRRIREARLFHPAVARFAPPVGLTGRRITAVDRRAKLLRLHLDDDRMLVVHLKMSGRLWAVTATAPSLPHTHWVADLDDDLELRFVDPRRFGFVGLLDAAGWQAWDFARTLGPEPLATAPAALAARFIGRRAIKAVLLDQRAVAGVGNIYADESLFAAGVHPATPAHALTAAQRLRLACALQEVLQAAIAAGGSTISDYRDAHGRPGLFQERFAVYGRAGQPCPGCATPLTRIVVAGRGTVFCPRCQPGPHAYPPRR